MGKVTKLMKMFSGITSWNLNRPVKAGQSELKQEKSNEEKPGQVTTGTNLPEVSK
jgi:hypothetical protein